jgi:DNA-binding transcriptional LysR family regulator
MELQQLRCFSAVATELHFARAAEKMHMAQQAVSFQVKQLEKELGVQLFHRTTRKVSLTTAGEAMLEEVKQVFAHLDRGVEEARRADRGERGRLVVGYVHTMSYSILPAAVKSFRSRYPDVKVLLAESTPVELENKLLDGTVDVALSVKAVGRDGLPDFDWRTLSIERMTVAVPRSHPLAGEKMVKLTDLSDESFVLVNGNALMHDCFRYVCRQAGFAPRVVQEAANDQSAIFLAAAGMGVALVFGFLNKLYENQVVYLPLIDPTFEFEFALYWRRDHSLSLVNHFVDDALNQISISSTQPSKPINKLNYQT